MKTIFKYNLEITHDQNVTVYDGYKIIHVGKSPLNELCMWVQVDTDAPPHTINVHVFGTGHPLEHHITHVGSAVVGSFVWHVYTGDC